MRHQLKKIVLLCTCAQLLIGFDANGGVGREDDEAPAFWETNCVVVARVTEGIAYGGKTLQLQVIAVIATDITVPTDLTVRYVAGGNSSLDGDQLLTGKIIVACVGSDSKGWYLPSDGIPCIGHDDGSAAVAVTGLSDERVAAITKRVRAAREKAHGAKPAETKSVKEK